MPTVRQPSKGSILASYVSRADAAAGAGADAGATVPHLLERVPMCEARAQPQAPAARACVQQQRARVLRARVHAPRAIKMGAAAALSILLASTHTISAVLYVLTN